MERAQTEFDSIVESDRTDPLSPIGVKPQTDLPPLWVARALSIYNKVESDTPLVEGKDEIGSLGG